jgi:PAS domain S-box-containing protein
MPARHILVVDDQPGFCMLVKSMLENQGYAVDTANTVADADRLIRSRTFDTVISDICFDRDNEDGLTLLQRSLDLQPETPVILITGMPSIATASTAVRLNAFDYLSKPFSQHTLSDCVARAVEYKGSLVEKKEAEIESRKYRDNLEQLVKTHTENLEQTNRRYQLLFENSKDAIYMASRDGGILAINQSALDLFGYMEDELVQLRCEALYADTGHRHRFQQAIENNGFVKDFKVKMKHKSGRLIDCLLTAHLLVEPDGAILGYQGIVRDITDQKRAEKKIRTQNAFLVNVIESLAHPFMVVDVTDYTIKIANSAAKRRQAGNEKFCYRLNHGFDEPCHQKGIRCPLQKVVQSRQPVCLEHFHIDPDGGSVEYEVHAFPLLGKDGAVLQVIQYYIDISKKKRLESIAEAANLMDNLGYIFSGIRHEIGNPINSVKMALSVLSMNLDRYPRTTIREFVDRGLGELARVEYLLKALKNFSMFESPALESTLMSRFLVNFMKLVESDFIDKGVRIRLELPGENVYARIDHRAFHQVLLNLLTNSADAMQECESPCITIKVGRVTGHRVLISVADNGCGMNATERDNLFRPFLTTKPHGTGLGLVIVKKMLARMGSSIMINSSPGKGTTVIMNLPEGKRPNEPV